MQKGRGHITYTCQANGPSLYITRRAGPEPTIYKTQTQTFWCYLSLLAHSSLRPYPNKLPYSIKKKKKQLWIFKVFHLMFWFTCTLWKEEFLRLVWGPVASESHRACKNADSQAPDNPVRSESLGRNQNIDIFNLLPRKFLVWQPLMQNSSFPLLGNLDFLLITMAKDMGATGWRSFWQVVRNHRRSIMKGTLVQPSLHT